MKRRMEKKGAAWSLWSGIVYFLDVLVIILMIVTSSTLILTFFGRMTLVFSFLVSAFGAILKVMQRW